MRKMHKFTLLAAGLGLAAGCLTVAACSSMPGDQASAAGSAKRCVSAPLQTTRIVNANTLYIEDQSGQAALMHMAGSCLGNFNEAVRMTFRGSTQICGPHDVDVTGQITSTAIPCFAESLEMLNKEQAASYRDGDSKKKTW